MGEARDRQQCHRPRPPTNANLRVNPVPVCPVHTHLLRRPICAECIRPHPNTLATTCCPPQSLSNGVHGQSAWAIQALAACTRRYSGR